MPTCVSTPGRLAAASRSMSRITPDGRFHAPSAFSAISRRILGGSNDEGPLGYDPPITRASSPGSARWSMPLMPYMSPAAIGITSVRPRGRPLARKRSPSACNVRSGVLRPDDELTATTAPSGIAATASSKLTTLPGITRTTS